MGNYHKHKDKWPVKIPKLGRLKNSFKREMANNLELFLLAL